MSVFANVLLPEPFGPMMAWISPLPISSERPLRISLPSMPTWRSWMTSSLVWLMCPSSRMRCRPRGSRYGTTRRRPARAAGRWSGGNRSGREALSARAAVPHVRVVELESSAHQSLDVVDLGAGQDHGALEVHEQAHAVRVER